VPEGVSVSDNPFINKIAEMANVEFTEVTVPAYTDFITKFNLMVASGDIPDFLHCWSIDEVQKHGNMGAFLELTDVIKNSTVLSKKYNDEILELMKDEKGKIYALRTLGTQDPASSVVRKDLIDELNDGIMPITPDEWYEVFKKQKAKYPDSTPYSSPGGLWGLEIFFNAYGVSINISGANWQCTNGKFINAFEAPLCKEAIIYHKKLYDEGLLDKTFVTNKLQDYIDRKYNKGVLIAPNNLRSVISYIGNYKKNSIPSAVIVPGPLPKVDDERIENTNVYPALAAIGGHCVSISANTKNKDAVIRLIEVLLSDEVKNMTSWGREGIEYNIANNKKTLNIEKSTETSYRSIYSFMFTYGSEEHVKTALEGQIGLIDEAKRAEYRSVFEVGMKVAYDQASSNKSSITPASFIHLLTDTVSKRTEALELSKAIILKAITGEISLEEYDVQVAEFLKTYKSITDEYNTKHEEAKAKYTNY